MATHRFPVAREPYVEFESIAAVGQRAVE